MWNHLYVNYASTTAISATGPLYANTTGYPQSFFGTIDPTPIANVEIDSQSEGNYTSFGVKNGSYYGSFFIDNNENIVGIPNSIILQNHTGSATCLNIQDGGYSCLSDYNTLSSLFDTISPAYNAAGTEAGLTTTLQQQSGNDALDVGIQNYPGSAPTGIDEYFNSYSSTYAQPLPTPHFSFWEQANGNTSEAQTSWGWMGATTTISGVNATTTSIDVGDLGNTAMFRTLLNPANATLNVISSSSKATAFTVAENTNGTLSTDFQVSNAGNASSTSLTISGLPSQSCLGTDSSGNIQAGTCSGGSSPYPFPLAGNATSSPLMITASTTIGNNTTIGGLTVNGGATTTGNTILSTGGTTIIGESANTTGAKLEVNGDIKNNGQYFSYPSGYAGKYFFIQSDGSTGFQLGGYSGGFVGVKLDGNPLNLNTRAVGTVNIGASGTASPLNVYGTASTSDLYDSKLGGNVAGTFIAADPNGHLIATTTPSGGSGTVTSVGLSSTNSTLSIGSTPVTTAGTITADLNLGHSNLWTVLQSFLDASSTDFSSNTAQFGATATTTIDGGGNVPVPSGAVIHTPELVLATSSSMTIGMASSTNQYLKFGSGNITITMSTYLSQAGNKMTLETCNGTAGTGGTLTFANLHYSGAIQPGNTTAANQCDLWYFMTLTGTTTTPIVGLTGMTSGIQ